MSLDYKFQPLDGFPRPLKNHWQRDKSPFGKTWSEVLQLLERELRFLSYRTGSVVLQTAHSQYDVRKDGKLRADVRAPEHPGVVLKFDVYDSKLKKYVQMSFECDQFAQWKANVRAIADALEALRKVNRYGVTGGGKADAHYAGYKALPEASVPTDLEWAINVLMINSAYSSWDIESSKEIFQIAYRQAAHNLHPDKGGSHEKFVELQKAKSILERHFG